MEDKSSIGKLYSLSKKPSRIIVGLMSGTSLDGLDIAVCRFTGSGLQTKVAILEFKTSLYPDDFQAEMRQVFAKRTVDLQQVCILNAFIAKRHADLIKSALREWNITPHEVDLIASHGQTVFHAPAMQHQIPGLPNATLQIGDGDHIARETGIITLSDFRQKHVAAGGEGAPLAIYGDYLMFSSKQENRVMLNIGGIANFTYLPRSLNSKEVFCTDIGPGNTLMDAFVRANFVGKRYDTSGEIAGSGRVNGNLLTALLDHPFFKQAGAKTTGPELFNLDYLQVAFERSNTGDASLQDILSTLNSFTAQALANALNNLPITDFVVYVSGGGGRNPVLISRLQNLLPHNPIKTTGDLGINPDAKEAVLFAALANECIAGNPIQIGKLPPIRLGKISLPD